MAIHMGDVFEFALERFVRVVWAGGELGRILIKSGLCKGGRELERASWASTMLRCGLGHFGVANCKWEREMAVEIGGFC